MTRICAYALLTLPVLAGPALAGPPPEMLYVGTDMPSIIAALDDMGYDIISTGEDESGFEVEIADWDDIYDLTIDPVTGLIIGIEFDSDEDGDA